MAASIGPTWAKLASACSAVLSNVRFSSSVGRSDSAAPAVFSAAVAMAR